MADNAAQVAENITGVAPPSDAALDQSIAAYDAQQAQYGTPGQQTLAGAEGAAQGLAGPVVPTLEVASGLTTGEAIRGRAAANPLTHLGTEAGAFIGSLLFPATRAASLAGTVGHVGEAAGVAASKVLPKLAATGIRTGAELAALQASDELTKMVTSDPSQTLGNAAANIGMAGLIGGVAGVGTGVVSNLFSTGKQMLTSKLLSDGMGETGFLQKAVKDAQGEYGYLASHPNQVVDASNELAGRMDEAAQMHNTWADMKPEVLAQALPEPTPENIGTIDAHIADVSREVEEKIAKAPANVQETAQRVYNQFLSDVGQAPLAATIDQPAQMAPSLAEKYLALNKLKQETAGWAKWAYQGPEATALGSLGREISTPIRAMLEDPEIWGGAADVQRVTNAAQKEAIDASKAFRTHIETNNQVDPVKVNALLNQAAAGKVSRKVNVVGDYLEKTQKLADAINKVHIDNGLESPLAASLNPTPTLDHALGTELTPGVKFARWAHEKGANALSGALGRGAGGSLGGSLGFLVGHPLAGTWAGEKVLGPVFSAMAKPLLERPINAIGAKAAVDYVSAAARGLNAVKTGVSNLLSPTAQVLTKDMLPTQGDRDKLQKSLDIIAQEPDKAVNLGTNLGAYLPDHQTALAMLAGRAASYLSSLRPKPTRTSPMDTPVPPNSQAMAQYNRTLNIAQNPLLVLQHVKDGSLLPQDITTLQTLYPGLHETMVRQVTNALVNGAKVPYAQRTSLSTFIGGQPLDSTMTPQARQTIMASAMTQQQAPQNVPKRASGVELKQINKVNDMYQTKLEAREVGRRQ